MSFRIPALLLLAYCLAAPPGQAAQTPDRQHSAEREQRAGTASVLQGTETISYEGSRLSLHIRYPIFGRQRLDDRITEWAQNIAELFRVQAEEVDTPPDRQSKYSIQVSYQVLAPSPHVLSLVMNIAGHTDNTPHDIQQLLVRNYVLSSGAMLDFSDLFKKPRTALTLLSFACDKDLQQQLGDEADIWWIKEGTEPTEENFTALALISGGLRIFFQPSQVAPSSRGILHVDVPLQTLLAAQPNIALWNRQPAPLSRTAQR